MDNWRKLYYNPLDSEDINSDDDICDTLDNCDEVQLVLFPPNDGADTYKDDATSDGECVETFRDLGKGVLAQPMEIICKTHADKGITVKAPLVLPREDDYTTSDEETLAHKAKRLKEIKIRKKRAWKKSDK
ncbi:hypothetical protein QE152_g24476 [Popillia japonica]|uniref:Uncharacterized protein n=1 Tax=Popillia japonica TaxID=7064 RepID=A0AAW1KB13_POPJA